MNRILIASLIFVAIVALSQCRKAEPFDETQYDERMSGGTQTAFDGTSHSFSHVFTGISEYDVALHGAGDAGFEQSFITAPATRNSGLGPAYNNVSCSNCHHNDGIGIPTAGDAQSSLLIRISVPGIDGHGGAMPVPGYGTQVQDKAVFGKLPEAKVNITYINHSYSFADGETYELREPFYSLTELYTPINGNYMLSPRLAPPVFGLGLLEAIPEADIIALADISDANHDGISGKPNYVWNPYKERKELGRFGLKLNTSSILVQVAAAYNNDIGITSYVFKNETSQGQPNQSDGINDDPEITDSILNAVKFYMQTLQVPARRNVTDAQVIKGKQIFKEAKCTSCHHADFTTEVNVAFPALSNQRIHPYTDMLLHDMGPGLADNRPDFDADGNEWRTSPLWGVGLFEAVNYPAYYLHDGRARTLTEAIMWHGGEAQQSKEYVEQLSKADRDALIKFLRSL
ncbi:MAG: di-heme oxidoredictase family protein [Bacteroidota bacterium]